MERVQCGLMQASHGVLSIQIDSVASLKKFGWTLLISLLIDKEIRPMGLGHDEKRAVLNFSLVIRSDTNMGPATLKITIMIFKIKPKYPKEFFFFVEVITGIIIYYYYFLNSNKSPK